MRHKQLKGNKNAIWSLTTIKLGNYNCILNLN